MTVYCDYEDEEKLLPPKSIKDAFSGRQINAALVTLKWNSDTKLVTEGTIPPRGISLAQSFMGTLNKSAVHIYGTRWSSGRLRHLGPEVKYQNGEWTYYHVALGRTYYPAIPTKGRATPKRWEFPTIDEKGKPAYEQIYPYEFWGMA